MGLETPLKQFPWTWARPQLNHFYLLKTRKIRKGEKFSKKFIPIFHLQLPLFGIYKILGWKAWKINLLIKMIGMHFIQFQLQTPE